MLPQTFQFLNSLEISRINNADRDEDHILKVIRHKSNRVEQRMHAKAAVAANKNHGRMFIGVRPSQVWLTAHFDGAQGLVQASQAGAHIVVITMDQERQAGDHSCYEDRLPCSFGELKADRDDENRNAQNGTEHE